MGLKGAELTSSKDAAGAPSAAGDDGADAEVGPEDVAVVPAPGWLMIFDMIFPKMLMAFSLEV
jgi:hypothetical protein